MESRICSKCGTRKPLDQYYKYATGLIFRICKSCCNLASVARARRNPDEAIRRAEQYRLNHMEDVNNRVKRYYHKNKHGEKIKARVVSRYAQKRGILIPQPCQYIEDNGCACGNARTHGHHPDYKEPLNVIWLCPKHHAYTSLIFRHLTKCTTAECVCQ